MNKVQGYADHPNPNPRVVRILQPEIDWPCVSLQQKS